MLYIDWVSAVMELSTQPLSTSIGGLLQVRVLVVDVEYEYQVVTFFAVKLDILKSVAGICCIKWNHFFSSLFKCLLPL